MIVIFRGFFSLYFILVILQILSAVSRLFFKDGDMGDKLADLLEDIWFAMFFPIMIFSKEGISKLVKQIREYT